MTQNSKDNYMLSMLTVGLFSWIVPGGGYFLIQEKKRAIIVFVTISLTFLTGLYIGSIGVIDPVGSWPWYLAQVLTSPTVLVIGHLTAGGAYPSYGQPNAIGQIYTSVAGLLNPLSIAIAV